MKLTAPTPADWAGFPAFRFANAHLEAVVVPALGRVMRFARAGGDAPNQLWTDTLRREGDTYVSVFGWANWGGDKTWLAPQARWRHELGGVGWMGDPAWGEPIHGEHRGEVCADGVTLRVTGPVSPRSGLRLSRDYRLDGEEFVIVQRVENVAAPRPVRVALWSVTNVPRPDCFYALPAAASDYPGGVRLQVLEADEIAFGREGPLVTFRPANRRPIKFGLDADYAALAMLRDGEIFVQRAERPPGDYPDGERGRTGLCVEYFDSGSDAPLPYAELELLGPLTDLAPGAQTTHTVRWRLYAVGLSRTTCRRRLCREAESVCADAPADGVASNRTRIEGDDGTDQFWLSERPGGGISGVKHSTHKPARPGTPSKRRPGGHSPP